MNTHWILRGGRLIDPAQNIDAPADLWIENGKIRALLKPGEKAPAAGSAQELDCKGYWVTPGLIDAHVHLREPGLEYKETIETGTRAAVAGGFTSVACMANTLPVNDSPYVTAFIRERAKTASCRVFPIGAVSKGLKGQELAEIGGMAAEGVVALSDDGYAVMNSYLARKAMDYAKAFGLPVISHAEDMNLVGQGVMNEGRLSNELGLRGSPAAAEEILVARDIALCRLTRCPLHIAHISTKEALEHVLRAKEAGLPVTAEVTPHHLTLNEEALRTYDTHCKMNPPLRTQADVLAMGQALSSGLIDIIATDHAPHGIVDKCVEFDQAANGIIGLQTAVPLTLALVHAGLVKPSRWVESLTIAPARLLNIPYGTLKVGAAADLTVIDPNERWSLTDDGIKSKSRNSPFKDTEFKGRVKQTWVGGELR